MSIYGSFAESKIPSLESIDINSLTEADFDEIGKEIFECLVDLIESDDIFDEEFIEEGANLEMNKALRTYMNSTKIKIKSAKKKAKKDDFDGAKADLKEAQSLLSKMEKEIRAQKNTIGSAMIGNILSNCMICAEMILPIELHMCGAIVSVESVLAAGVLGAPKIIRNALTATSITLLKVPIGAIIGAVKGLLSLIKITKQIIKESNNKENSTADVLNGYRSKCLSICSDLNKQIGKATELIDKRETKSKEK